MRALRFAGGDVVELVDVAEPRPGEGQALVRIHASAVCGSERGALAAGHPTNTGHEAAGSVVSAPGFEPGERVGISAVVGCGVCPSCQAGVEVRCPSPVVQTGFHADYAVVDPRSLRRLPADIDTTTGVLLSGDGLGVPARGLRMAPTSPGDRVLVIGLGPVGLASVLVRAAAGCEVVAVEPSPFRRALGSSLGAAKALDPTDDLSHDLGGFAPDLVIEASGRAESVRLALSSVKRGGTVLQAAEGKAAEISPSTLVLRELTYVGSWYYAAEDWPVMTALVADGLPVRSLVTHELPPEEAPAAYRAFLSTESGKVVLRWAPDE
jgi:threonine dehydrogenase-like Zn-dependent dehydrogenase